MIKEEFACARRTTMEKTNIEKILLNLMMMNWKIAKEKGWHELPRSFGDLIALCHSELSEALEEYRQHGLDPVWFIYFKDKKDKPEGIAVELADVLIRLFDMCVELEIPILTALMLKMSYNKTREYRHGNKTL